MKKQTSVVAIVIAVIMSILLFPLIVGTGMASGVIFSAESMLEPGREMELYDVFVEQGGVDWVYDLFLEETGETIAIEEDLVVEVREMFPKEDIGALIKEFYQAVIRGETYSAKFPEQRTFMEQQLMQYFDENADKWLREEFGESYDFLDEATKTEAIALARETYQEEVKVIVDGNFDDLEAETDKALAGIYENAAFQEIKEIEAEYGYSLTDRTELCAVLNLTGYIMLGVCCFFLLLLLICHLFRPSGFITAGVFALLTGGLMKLGAAALPETAGRVMELDAVESENLPAFAVELVKEVFSWCMSGFDKVGMLGLSAGIILVLIGILLLVLRGNRTAA